MEFCKETEQMEQKQGVAAFQRESTMMVCIQGQDEVGIYGKIVNQYLEEAVAFHGVGNLILKLDEICDWLGTPRRAAQLRLLNSQQNRNEDFAETEYTQVVKTEPESSAEVLQAKEVLAVHIEYRQNASLQGFVCGKLTEGERVSFRSALELMYMFQMISL